MRYTLHLLTLDQLSRAATLICALELERLQDVTKLGDWPFEIGLMGEARRNPEIAWDGRETRSGNRQIAHNSLHEQ